MRLTAAMGNAMRTPETTGCINSDGLWDVNKLVSTCLSLETQRDELLAALERAFLAFGRAGGNTINGPFRKEWEDARAAIARATGK